MMVIYPHHSTFPDNGILLSPTLHVMPLCVNINIHTCRPASFLSQNIDVSSIQCCYECTFGTVPDAE